MDEARKHILKLMRTTTSVRINGGAPQFLTNSEVLTTKMFEAALKGGINAIRLVYHEQRIAAAEEKAEIEEKRAAWTLYRREQERACLQSKEAGRDPNLVVPHPDDIIIDNSGGRITGPFDEAELQTILWTVALRNHLYLQQALEDYRERPSDSPMLLAQFLNANLPRRFTLTNFDELMVRSSATKHTRRRLLKLTHEGWRKLGIPLTRGACLADIGYYLTLIDAILELRHLSQNENEDEQGQRRAADHFEQRILDELRLGNRGPVPSRLVGRLGLGPEGVRQ